VYQWFEVRSGQLVRLEPGTIQREASRRRRPRLSVPFNRKCPQCRVLRKIGQWKSHTAGFCYRAWCPTCKATSHYDLKGKSLALKSGRTLALAFPRPTCHCGRVKVIGGRVVHKVLGKVVHFICPECPRVKSEELWTAAGRPVNRKERKAAEGAAHQKTADFAFDRAKIRCPEPGCGLPMRYRGRLKRGASAERARQPHHFFCPEHRAAYRFVDDQGSAVTVQLLRRRGVRKGVPWGERPKCPTCDRTLHSLGEWEDSNGRRLFRMQCPSRTCPEGRFHFDETGELVKRASRLFRRSLRLRRRAWGTTKIWCVGCGGRPVRSSEDRRFRYCEACASVPPQSAWNKQQERLYGIGWIMIRRHLGSGTKIRGLRQAVSWTQQELAQRANVSLPLIKKIEQGSASITKKSKEALMRAFASVDRATSRAVGLG